MFLTGDLALRRANQRACFFNPALRGMDVRREPVAEPTDVQAAALDDETMMPSRTTDIH